MPATGGRSARLRQFGCHYSVLVPFLVLSAVSHAQSTGSLGASPKDDPWTVRTEEAVGIDIPRAAERPISADDGPRVQVQSFNLDIDAALQAALRPALVAEMRSLVETRRQSNQPAEGFTIGQMEEVAAAVRDFLRSHDFIVAYAYLPTQQVQDGQVTIGVLSGSLGAVAVEGNRMLSSERLQRPFGVLLGQPLQKKSLEKAILSVRDYPGVAPSAVLSPGTEVGTTNLTLRVLERRAAYAVMVDNYGTEETGDGRARIKADWNNPLGRGDRLTFNVLQTFSPAEGTFGGVAYESPIGGRGLFVGALYDENTFDITSNGLQVGGDSRTMGLFARQSVIRGRELNFDVRLALEVKEAAFDIEGLENQDDLSVVSLGFDLEAVDRIGALGVNSLAFEYHRGIADFLGSMDEAGVGEDGKLSTRIATSGRAGADFDKYTLRYQRLQQLNLANSLILRAYGQYTKDVLTSLEQMAAGGPYSVRAYPTAEFLVDKGVFGSAEYVLNVSSLLDIIPESWDLNVSAFYDYSEGRVIDALSSERDTVKLGGYGVGAQYEFRWGNGNGVMLRAEVAKPHTNAEPSNGRDPQYWLRAEYFRR